MSYLTSKSQDRIIPPCQCPVIHYSYSTDSVTTIDSAVSAAVRGTEQLPVIVLPCAEFHFRNDNCMATYSTAIKWEPWAVSCMFRRSRCVSDYCAWVSLQRLCSQIPPGSSRSAKRRSGDGRSLKATAERYSRPWWCSGPAVFCGTRIFTPRRGNRRLRQWRNLLLAAEKRGIAGFCYILYLIQGFSGYFLILPFIKR